MLNMCKLKIVFGYLAIIVVFQTLNGQNPISPPGVYLADPTARVWADGKLWIYGSADETCNYYCSRYHHALSTTNMIDWQMHDSVFASVGKNDGVSYNNGLLFAPDIMERDGKYFMYYCQPNTGGQEGVAFADTPDGPFLNGQKFDLGNHSQIDPAIFIDDDGQAYYLWGQFTLKMVKINQDMKTLDMSSLNTEVLNEKEHFFHEGAFMEKRNGIYYLVYADISRSDRPTCIGYSTSKSPFGPYTYRGVIVDNDGCSPGNWNNHGSIVEFNGQWYVFYHRATHGCDKMRKACVEAIEFNADGTIDEVLMTSQGTAPPFTLGSKIEAEWACLISGNAFIEQWGKGREYLKGRGEAKMVYRYVDFKAGASSVTIRLKQSVAGDCSLILCPDFPWYKPMATINIVAGDVSNDYKEYTFPINSPKGLHALYILTKGSGDIDIDNFIFNP